MKKVVFFCFLSFTCFAQGKVDSIQILKRIKNEFIHINSHLYEYDKKEINIDNESSEGEVITGYYNGLDVVKVYTATYGETGKVTREYFFKDNQLFFIFECKYTYDKPFYVKGSKISVKKESRFYFYDQKLFKWIKSINEIGHADNNNFNEEGVRQIKRARYYMGLLGSYKKNSIQGAGNSRCSNRHLESK